VIVTRFLSRDGEGSTVLRPRIYREGGIYREEPVPEISLGILRAVRSMGG
jgi:hypothetical protein